MYIYTFISFHGVGTRRSLSYVCHLYAYIYIYVSRDIAACPHLHASARVHYSPYTPPRERTIGNASRRLSSTRRDFTIQSLFRVRLSAKGKHVPCRTRFPQADNSAYYTTKLQRQRRHLLVHIYIRASRILWSP